MSDDHLDDRTGADDHSADDRLSEDHSDGGTDRGAHSDDCTSASAAAGAEADSDEASVADGLDEEPHRSATEGSEIARERERLPEADRVSDDEWADFVSGLSETAVAGDRDRVEIADALEEAEGWTPPPAPPIGWRTAPPAKVLAIVGALLSVAGLVLCATALRGAPTWLLLALIAVGIASGVALVMQLPTDRDDDAGWEPGA